MKRRKHKKNLKGGIIVGLLSTIGAIGWIRSICLNKENKELEDHEKEWETDKELLATYQSFIYLWKRPLKRLANDRTRWQSNYRMGGKDSDAILKEVCDLYDEDYDDVKPE